MGTPKVTPKPDDLTVSQVARMLGRTTMCVRQWLLSGKLAGGYRTGTWGHWRIPQSSLDAFLIPSGPPPAPPGKRFRRVAAGRQRAARADGVETCRRAGY